MDTEALPHSAASEPVSEDAIRDYAYHLYVQSGHRNDQCCANWREARACIAAGVAKSESHIRLCKSQTPGTP
jgi:hypothetical protein